MRGIQNLTKPGNDELVRYRFTCRSDYIMRSGLHYEGSQCQKSGYILATHPDQARTGSNDEFIGQTLHGVPCRGEISPFFAQHNSRLGGFDPAPQSCRNRTRVYIMEEIQATGLTVHIEDDGSISTPTAVGANP
jgi:hypothetical protein